MFCHTLSITDTATASGDIRNIVKPLTGVPGTYAGHCEVVVNDKDSDIVARNAILLLTAFHFSPDAATPMMLHGIPLWYPHKCYAPFETTYYRLSKKYATRSR